MENLYPLQLIPEYRSYVWGGARLRPEIVPTAEAWVVYEKNQIANGPLAGQTLADLAGLDAQALLGRRVVSGTGQRFPLLIKLLDCAQWLSLQVHPDNALAEQIEGPGLFGKTEAWHILDAEPGARLIAGMKAGVQTANLAAAMGKKELLDLVEYKPVSAGETVFMPARTIHALGPGLLVYEVQQSSDLTYRVYDWDRPQTGGRVLHIEKSLQTADPAARCAVLPPPSLAGGQAARLCESEFFSLDLLVLDAAPVTLDTQFETFHALTVISGEARLEWQGQSFPLRQFETIFMPAACGAYQVSAPAGGRVLVSSI